MISLAITIVLVLVFGPLLLFLGMLVLLSPIMLYDYISNFVSNLGGNTND